MLNWGRGVGRRNLVVAKPLERANSGQYSSVTNRSELSTEPSMRSSSLEEVNRKDVSTCWSFPSGLVGRESTCNAGDTGDLASIHGWERSPGGGNGNPLWYSCLENPMDRGAQQAIVQGVAKSRTWVSTHTHVHLTRKASCQSLKVWAIPKMVLRFYTGTIIWQPQWQKWMGCWKLWTFTQKRNFIILIALHFPSPSLPPSLPLGSWTKNPFEWC